MIAAARAHLNATLAQRAGRLSLTALFAATLCLVSSAPASAAEPCPNEPFRIGLSANLPDCRAYEMVSPPYKQDQSIEGRFAASTDGTRIISASKGVFAGSENDLAGGLYGAFYEFTREGAGWTTRALDPPPSYTSAILEDASSDLSSSSWLMHSSSRPEGVEEFYIRGADGVFRLVGPATAGTTAATSDPASSFQEPTYLGSSADLNHALFSVTTSSNFSLWRGDTTVTAGIAPSLYEYTGTENTEPRLVGVKNEGRLEGQAYVNEGAELVSNCGTQLGGFNQATNEQTMYNAISHDGTTIFFTTHGRNESSPCRSAERDYRECEERGEFLNECEEHFGPPASGPPVGEVYARVNGSATVDISEPPLSTPGRQCTGHCQEVEENEELHSEGIFEGASEDGLRVFVRTAQPLIDEDEDETSDLYEVQLEGANVKQVVLVSRGGEGDPKPGQGAEVLGVARISADGSHVYFVARGLLTSGQNGEGEAAETGADNFYLYDTQTEQTSFVARLNEATDSRIWAMGNGIVQATPDGRFLVFKSGAQLTGDDRSGPQAPQIFRYDAQSGALVRISTGQNGNYLCPATEELERYNCNGNTSSGENAPTMTAPPYARSDLATTAASSLTVSSDGSVVVFASRNSLTPQAVPGVRNVYEYRGGEVFLISSGQGSPAPGSAEEAFRINRLLGLDASGQDIFFASGVPLLGQTSDTSFGFYDARSNGGFPSPPSPAGCESEACRGPLGATPSPQAPGTAAFSGQGNPRPHRKQKKHVRHERNRKHHKQAANNRRAGK